MAGKILYAVLFCITLPALIVWGAWVLEPVITLPLPRLPLWCGAAAASAGGVLMLAGMLALLRQGGGLPMNGFPPVRLVSDGIYALLPHPIYCGSVLLCGGVSLWLQSRAGFYLFTPLVAAGTLAIVWGYERKDIFHRFGKAGNLTWFGIPPWTEEKLSFPHRVTAGLFPFFFASLADTASLELWLVNGAIYLWSLTRRNNRASAVYLCRWLCASLGVIFYRSLAGTDGLPLAALLLNLVVLTCGGKILRALYRLTAKLCNSYRAWRFGPVRIINHAIYTFLAAAAGFYGAAALSGADSLAPLLLITISSLIGGALWAQFIEGSARLLRPFGYYGAVFGAISGILLCAIFLNANELWILFAALATVAPWTHSIGRLRCMVQGCCHGGPLEHAEFFAYGVRHVNPSSRVCKFTEFIDKPLHSSQLYSIFLNLPIGLLLLILWQNRLPAGLITGLYFMLTALARFIEEGWRGEPQTRRFCRLTEYQWLCVLFVAIAFAIWSIPGSMIATPSPVSDGWGNAAAACGVGLLYVFAMSMDFPDSNRRFSRLTG